MVEEYALSVFGLTGTQRMVLSSLCKLSRNRGFTYSVQDRHDSRPGDILIVDADDSDAVQQWKQSRNPRSTPVVHVSAKPLIDLPDKHYNIARSQLSGGLLQLLNRVVVNELGHLSYDKAIDGRKTHTVENAPSGKSVANALVIDDSLSARTQIRLCLEKLDIDVSVAENATEALERLNELFFHIIFLDVILPDMDGYQVCKLIKKDPLTRHVPVVMLTSKGSTINRLQGSIAGCDRYLVKPAAENDVLSIARDLLPIPSNRKTGRQQDVRHNNT